MKAVILCGGKGTRAYPQSIDLPKPLLAIAGRPILRHIMEVFAAQGFRDFVLAAGFRSDLIERFAAETPNEWDVAVVDTGESTNTGGRVLGCRHLLDEPFLLTYGDGLGDVDLGALIAFHDTHAGAATVTTVPLPSPYGTVLSDADGRVRAFKEKPRLPDHWINAGFMVLDPRAFEHWGGEDLESEVLPALAAAGELFAHRHEGFWKSMDTYKDALELASLCQDGSVPWLRSKAVESS